MIKCSVLGSILQSSAPPRQTLQQLKKLKIRLWPMPVLAAAIKHLHKAKSYHALALLPEVFSQKDLDCLQRRVLLVLAKTEALVCLKDYEAALNCIEEISGDTEINKRVSGDQARLLKLKARASAKLGIKNGAKDDLPVGASLDKPTNSHRRNLLLEYRSLQISGNLAESSPEFIALAEAMAEKEPDKYLMLASSCIAKQKNQEAQKYIVAYFNRYKLPAPGWESAQPHLENLTCGDIPFVVEGPLVTVIMTCFNAEKTIGYALKSLLDQSYRNLEVFVVDDASQDRTVEFVKETASKDKRIRLLQNPVNSGTYVSKNTAILQARGKYITFHDSDDWHHPLRIEIQVDACERNPGLKGTLSSWIRIADNGVFIQASSLGFLHSNLSSLLVRREVFEDAGYFDSVRIAADGEFNFRLEAHYGLGCIGQLKYPLALGLHHDHALTRSGSGAYAHDNTPSTSRTKYWGAYSRWHREQILKSLPIRLDFPLYWRPFPAPQEILAQPCLPALSTTGATVIRVARIGGLSQAYPPAGYGGTQRSMVQMTIFQAAICAHDITHYGSADSTLIPYAAGVAKQLQLSYVVNEQRDSIDIRNADGRVGRIVFKTTGTTSIGYGHPDETALTDKLFELLIADEKKQAYDMIHNHNKKQTARILIPAGLGYKTLTHNHGVTLANYKNYQYPMICISRSQAELLASQGGVVYDVIYHSLDAFTHHLIEEPAGYLVWIGRIIDKKGADDAIAIARQANKPILLAGTTDASSNKSEIYFNTTIKSLIDVEDRELPDRMANLSLEEIKTELAKISEKAGTIAPVIFVGAVNEVQKQMLYGYAAATLFPITWPEPFGRVMIESMACGTPVIGYTRVGEIDCGSVREVIEDGVTGFHVSAVDNQDAIIRAARAVSRLGELDRKEIRKVFERDWNSERLARQIDAAYRRCLAQPIIYAEAGRFF